MAAVKAPDPDLSEFYRLSQPKKPPCRIGFVLSQLKPKERPELTAALAIDNNIITAKAIEEWCDKRGHTVTRNNVVSHRQGKCSCVQA